MRQGKAYLCDGIVRLRLGFWVKALFLCSLFATAGISNAESWEIDGPFAQVRGVQFTDAKGTTGRRVSLVFYCQFGDPTLYFVFYSDEEIDASAFFTFAGHHGDGNERIELRETEEAAEEDWYRGASLLEDDLYKATLMKLSTNTLRLLMNKHRVYVHWSDLSSTLEGTIRFDLDNAGAAILAVQDEEQC